MLRRAGAAPACAGNVRKAWKAMFDRAHSPEGRKVVQQAMRLCPHSRLQSAADVAVLANFGTEGLWQHGASQAQLLHTDTLQGALR